MIRLTVLYNLLEGSDEDAFLAWRLGDHQRSNAGMAGVGYTDFARITEGWPEGTVPAHRFMTTVEFSDWATFRAGFYDPIAQVKLNEDVKRITDYVYYVSEILVSERKESQV